MAGSPLHGVQQPSRWTNHNANMSPIVDPVVDPIADPIVDPIVGPIDNPMVDPGSQRLGPSAISPSNPIDQSDLIDLSSKPPRKPVTKRARGNSLRSRLFAKALSQNDRTLETINPEEPLDVSNNAQIEDSSNLNKILPRKHALNGVHAESLDRSQPQSSSNYINELSMMDSTCDLVGASNLDYELPRPDAGHSSWESSNLGPIDFQSRIILRLKRAKDFILRVKEIPPTKNGRQIPLRLVPPRGNSGKKITSDNELIDERTQKPYCNNQITSSIYTPYNFMPRQLFAQFSKLANLYFLVLSVMQMIPSWSTTGTYTTIVPLMFFILISIGREGYDDWRRHRQDKAENNRFTEVLRVSSNNTSDSLSSLDALELSEMTSDGSEPSLENRSVMYEKIQWKNLKVGDVVKLKKNDWVPADILVLSTTGTNDIAYIETMALDGETNLKPREPLPELKELCTPIYELTGLKENEVTIITEDPNLDLYNFEGSVNIGSGSHPLSSSNIIYRGSILRNTPTLHGMIIFSGEEAKIRMNAIKNPRTKAPRLQKWVNQIVMVMVVFVVFLAVFCTVAAKIYYNAKGHKMWFLVGLEVGSTPNFMGFIIMYNTLIPLSLYVSMEIVKVIQIVLLQWDIDMYHVPSDTPCEARTSTINEELGQISYIFSDKTGTLTDNQMVFRKFSVAGHAWVHDLDLRMNTPDDETPILIHKTRKSTASARVSMSRKSQSSVMTHHHHQQQQARDSHGDLRISMASTKAKGVTPLDAESRKLSVDILHQMESLPRKSNAGSMGGRLSMSSVKRTGTMQSSVWKSSADPKKEQTLRSTLELLQYLQMNPNSVYSRRCRFFLLSIAICHSCIPEFEGDIDDVKNLENLEYNAASPDEVALVSAARDLGYIVIDRQYQSVTICTYPQGLDMPPVNEVYKILETIEFSSARKRMSTLVQFPDGRICIICKGADNVILERLRSSELAYQKAADIAKQSDMRKTMEAEFIMARNSFSSLPRNSVSSAPRTSININRENAVNSLENWLQNTNQEEEVQEIALNARRSIQVARQRKYGEKIISPRMSLSSLGYHASEVPKDNNHNPMAELVNTANMLHDKNDFAIDDHLVLNEGYVIERTLEHIEDFSTEGLRTLLYSYRWMDKEEYYNWLESYKEARISLVDRQLKIEEAGELIEHNLELCGATAIEDKLQKGVPETIDKLRRANIKLWMLTGDKRETAVNVGYACRLIKDYSTIVVLRLDEGDLAGKITAALSELEAGRVAHCVVVVDGATLNQIEEDMTLMTLFIDLGVKADSVICCRASPSQKAAMVIAVRKKVKDSITLAIGDGANDIAMIQSADVGIGITGKEGLQAARTSDYSIAQFRYLSKLLLVHGRWNYVRICKYILGTFYKEIMFYLTQFFFQSNTMYTGSSLYENWSLSMFNTLFTSLPVICIGAFEKDMNPATLIAVPELYAKGQRNQAFNFRVFAGWMLLAMTQSALVSFLSYNFYGLYALRDNSTFAMGFIPFSACIVLITLKLQFLEVRARTYINLAVFVISVGGWFIWNLAIGGVMGNQGSKIFYVQHAFERRFGLYAEWWASFWVIIAICVTLEIIITTVRTMIAPTDSDIFAQLESDVTIRLRLEEEAWEELQAGWQHDGWRDDLEAQGLDSTDIECESQSTFGGSNNSSRRGRGPETKSRSAVRFLERAIPGMARHDREDTPSSEESTSRKRDSLKQKLGLGREERRSSAEYEREIEEILRRRVGDMDIELETRHK